MASFKTNYYLNEPTTKNSCFRLGLRVRVRDRGRYRERDKERVRVRVRVRYHVPHFARKKESLQHI
jgi:hypothetical protein